MNGGRIDAFFEGARAIFARIRTRRPSSGGRTTERLAEVDILRALALVMMLVYHLLFSITYLGIVEIEVLTGFWRWFAYATASLFILIAGLSLTLSESAQRRRGATPRAITLRIGRRGFELIGWGLVITVVTGVALEQGMILFGILHLIGVGTLLAIPFLRHPIVATVVGITCISLGPVVSTIPGPMYLAWLGFHPVDFISLDYVPILPWFGVLLLGVGLGRLVYPGGERRFSLGPIPDWTRPLSWIGRHTLAVYLLHEPAILLVLLAWQHFA